MTAQRAPAIILETLLGAAGKKARRELPGAWSCRAVGSSSRSPRVDAPVGRGSRDRACLDRAAAWRYREGPGLGPIRIAQLLPIVITPYRFRTKRQFWAYCGFGLVTRTFADWTKVGGRWVRVPAQQTRGLNRDCRRLGSSRSRLLPTRDRGQTS